MEPRPFLWFRMTLPIAEKKNQSQWLISVSSWLQRSLIPLDVAGIRGRLGSCNYTLRLGICASKFPGLILKWFSGFMDLAWRAVEDFTSCTTFPTHKTAHCRKAVSVSNIVLNAKCAKVLCMYPYPLIFRSCREGHMTLSWFLFPRRSCHSW